MNSPLPLFGRVLTIAVILLSTAAALLAQAPVVDGIDSHAYYSLHFNFLLTLPPQSQGPNPPPFYGGSGSLSIMDEATHAAAYSSIGGPALVGSSNTLVGQGATSVHILPNKDYVCTLSVSSGASSIVSFAPSSVSGFVVYINGKPATSFGFAPTGTATVTTFTLRVGLPTNYTEDPEPAYLAAGAASTMVADKPILYFGLGRMRNGNPAGVVGFRAQDFSSASFFTPSALYFASFYPVPAGEVTLIPVTVGANSIVLRQVLSREVLVDINAINSTSYKLDFYPASAVTGQPGGVNTPYAFTGSPFVTYTVSQNTATGVAVTRAEDGITWETDLVLNATTWTFNGWHKQGTSLNSNLTTAYSSGTAATVTANGPSSGLGSTVMGYTDTAFSWSKAFTSYSWGLELTNAVVGTSTTTPLVTNTSYYTTSAASGSTGAFQGLTQWTTNTDGTWAAYSYYVGDSSNATTVASGYVQRVYRPWLDTTVADTTGSVAAVATTANSAYTDFTYAYVAKGSGSSGGVTSALFLPASTISYAPGGTMLNKTTWSYNPFATTLNSRPVWSETENDFSSSTSSIATVSLYYVPQANPDLLDDQPVSVTYPTGRKDSYAYFNGSWNAASSSFTASSSGNDRLIFCFHGQTSGGTTVSSWTSGSVTWNMDSVSMVAGYSTATETVIDTNGRVVFTGRDVYTASSTLARVGGTASAYDSHGRLTDVTDIFRGNSSSPYKTHRTYTVALLSSETAPDGTATTFQYDDLLRQTQKTIGATSLANANIYPAKVQVTTYDGVNRPVATYACSCGTAPTVFWYDEAGRVIQKFDPSPNSVAPLSTSYAYSSLTSTTTTLPTGATIVHTNFADGRLKSIAGTAQSPKYYSYTANTTGFQVTQYNSDTSDQTNGWNVDQADFLGRNVSHSFPTYGWTATNNNIIDVISTYGSLTGLLTKRSTTYRATGAALSPDYLYTYDGSGRLNQEGLDINADGSLTTNSNDRFASYGFSYGTDAAGWLSIATTSVFPTASATQVAKTTTRLTGFSGTSGVNGFVMGDVSTTDANGQTTSQIESIDAATLRHHVDITVPGCSQVGWTETVNSYSSETLAVSGARTKNEYDSLGRMVTALSHWNGSAYTVADTVGFISSNYSKMPDSQTIGGVTTTYSYSWGSPSGTRTVTTTDAQGNTRITTYNAMDLLSESGGTAVPHVQYGYDALGRLTAMTTWHNGYILRGPSGESTIWTVEAATGLGTRKTFADGNHVDFTYTASGQLLTRTWARGTTTTYAYYDGSTTTTADVSHRTQELRSITYSDGTPTVSYTYKRSGLPDTIGDATGTHTFAYDPNQPLRANTETLSAFYGGRVVTQQYDAVFRPSGFTLSNSGNTANDLSQIWTYASSTGLPSTLVSIPAGQSARTFNYNFAPNTQLVTGWSTGTGATAYALSYGYEASTDRRNQVKSTMGGVTIAEFDPGYDNRGQMQTVAQSGSAFSDYYNSSYSSVLNAYAYDSKGQLQKAALYRGSTSPAAPASTDELPGHHFEFRYDDMGNRVSAGETGHLPTDTPVAGSDDSYTVNNLNQYTQKDNYTVRVTGTSATAPAGKSLYVAVAAASSSNQVDRTWGADVVPGQGASVASAPATVFAAIPGGGTGGSDLIRNDSSKSYTVPPTPQIFQYDQDGNLTSDGLWAYTYDAENRLVAMQNLSTAIGLGKILAANARKLVFTYDYFGRRVEKQVYGGWNGTVYSSTPIVDRKFVYNAWNMVAEYNVLSSSALVRSYTWGLDLDGSIGGSGGVGALVQLTDHTAGRNYYAAYDQNGNVVALERDDATLAAGYEYSAFGEPMRADVLDAAVADNPYRFSTKYTDVESGLVYYGMRYYVVSLGRFINRDPAQESGGINLYAFASNNPVSHWDVLGLDDGEDEKNDPPPGPPIVLPPFVVTPDDTPSPAEIILDYNTNSLLADINAAMLKTLNPDLRNGIPGVQQAVNAAIARNKAGKQASLDLLKKLCGTAAGRALVAALYNGTRSVREVSSSMLSPGLQKWSSTTAGASNEGAGVIYLFPDNYAGIANTLANSRFNYRGSVADFGASTLIHENLHFNNPPPPGPVPAGQAGRYEEALVRQMTDSQLPSYGLPQIFGLGSNFQAYLGTAPTGGVNLSTGKATSDYLEIAYNSTISQLDAASSVLHGWDCSRVP